MYLDYNDVDDNDAATDGENGHGNGHCDDCNDKLWQLTCLM